MKLSIIVPMLNEALTLPETLQQLASLGSDACEIIIVDGGSRDASVRIAEEAGFKVCHGLRGRARQMNAGATQATGDVLLFLHADTHLPKDFYQAICHAIQIEGFHWGRFDVSIEGNAWPLAIIALLINLRSRLSGISTGDQAQFVTRALFRQIGMFPDQPLMEDVELSKRLLALGRPACLRQKVGTSGRRWEKHGILRTVLLMWRLRWAYWRGTPAQDLVKAYL